MNAAGRRWWTAWACIGIRLTAYGIRQPQWSEFFRANTFSIHQGIFSFLEPYAFRQGLFPPSAVSRTPYAECVVLYNINTSPVARAIIAKIGIAM